MPDLSSSEKGGLMVWDFGGFGSRFFFVEVAVVVVVLINQ